MVKRTESYNLSAGRKLGSHYRILGFLGEGWEGEVYKVVEISTGIERAAKIYYPQRGRRAMTRYIHKLNKLKHAPVVLQYHHMDKARIRGQTVDFMVSEYVDGILLFDYIRNCSGKRLPSFEALSLLHAIATGVELIHQSGEYHGDLHSRNILVTKRGIGFRIKILDFLDLGHCTREKIFIDVLDLTKLLLKMVGGSAQYAKCGPEIKQIVLGGKHKLLRKRFRNAGELRLALEEIEW